MIKLTIISFLIGLLAFIIDYAVIVVVCKYINLLGEGAAFQTGIGLLTFFMNLFILATAGIIIGIIIDKHYKGAIK